MLLVSRSRGIKLALEELGRIDLGNFGRKDGVYISIGEYTLQAKSLCHPLIEQSGATKGATAVFKAKCVQTVPLGEQLGSITQLC